MGDDGRVNQAVPDLDDFGFGAAKVNAQVGEDARHQVGNFAAAWGARDLLGIQIHSAPRREDALARGGIVFERRESFFAIGEIFRRGRTN